MAIKKARKEKSESSLTLKIDMMMSELLLGQSLVVATQLLCQFVRHVILHDHNGHIGHLLADVQVVGLHALDGRVIFKSKEGLGLIVGELGVVGVLGSVMLRPVGIPRRDGVFGRMIRGRDGRGFLGGINSLSLSGSALVQLLILFPSLPFLGVLAKVLGRTAVPRMAN